MNPQVYLVALSEISPPAETADPLDTLLAQCGRHLPLQPGVWLLVSYQSLEEVLGRIGPEAGESAALLIVPFHEYGSRRLNSEIKQLIDAAWH